MRNLCVRKLAQISMALGGLAWGGFALAQDTRDPKKISEAEFEALSTSLNLDYAQAGHIAGFPVLLLGYFGMNADDIKAFGATLPPLTLADDASHASLSFPLSEELGILYDGQPSAEIQLLFEPKGDGNFDYRLAKMPKRFEFGDPSDLQMHVWAEIEDLTLEGIWEPNLPAHSQLSFSVGAIEVNGFDSSFRSAGAMLFMGALDQYTGNLSVELDGFEPTSAEAVLFDMGKIQLSSKVEWSEREFDVVWEGAEVSSVIGAPEGDTGKAVINALYGTPEILKANLALGQSLTGLDVYYADPESIAENLALLADLYRSMEAYIGIGSNLDMTVKPLSVTYSEYGDTTAIAFDSISVQSETLPQDVTDVTGGISIGAVAIDSPDLSILMDSADWQIKVTQLDLGSLIERFARLISKPGTWGDLSGMYLDAADAFDMSFVANGLMFSDVSLENSQDGVGFDNLEFILGLSGMKSAEGATLMEKFSYNGLVIPQLILDQLGVMNEYLSDDDNNQVVDLLVKDLSLGIKLSGLPVVAWQEQLDAVERAAPLFDVVQFEQEAKILEALSFQLLAPLIETPPSVTVELAAAADMFGLEASGDFDINPLTPPTYGKGEAVVLISGAEALLKHLLAVNKRLEKMLDANPDDFGFQDTNTLNEMVALADMLRTLRKIASVDDEGTYRFEIATDPVEFATVNGVGLGDTGLM